MAIQPGPPEQDSRSNFLEGYPQRNRPEPLSTETPATLWNSGGPILPNFHGRENTYSQEGEPGLADPEHR